MSQQHYDMIKHWMEIAGQTVNGMPTVPSDKDVLLRVKLLLEEAFEFTEACLIDSARESKLLNSVLQNFALARNDLEEFIEIEEPLKGKIDMKEALDAIVDIEVVNTGTAVTFGFDSPEGFKRVMDSNFSKFVDGKAIKNAAGKIMKGPNYKEPDLSGLY